MVSCRQNENLLVNVRDGEKVNCVFLCKSKYVVSETK